MTETPPETEPEDPGPCPSVYPHDPAITCQRQAGHNVRMLHFRQTGGLDSPYYEWE